ncbi:MAG: HlyC/CorC family transporter, partial [Planctomycetia bacterium]|nr:HlyC/CorC family transporter [Planctomycetia bacterium]
ESVFPLLLLASLAAVQARAVRGAQRHRIQERCRAAGVPGRFEEIIAGSETIAFIAASVVVIAAVVATLQAARRLFAASGGVLALEVSAVVGWIALVWLVLVVVPMLLTTFAGPWIVVATWRLWRPVVGVVRPVVGLLGRAASLLGRVTGRGGAAVPPERPQDELRLVVEEAHREGRIEGTARDMIRGVIGLDDVRVAQIMMPRTQMISIPLATDWDEAVRLAAASGHTRLPVWDRSSDDVVGILHTRDLLTRIAEGLPARPAAGAEQLAGLLREFQRGKTHMAIVTDEYGGVAGVVTIEDALEEIVGEIADEHDEAFSDGIRTVSADVCEVLAHVPVARVNERMGLALPEEEGYETIGGYVFHQCGRIPEVGETITAHGVGVEVVAATRQGGGDRPADGAVRRLELRGDALQPGAWQAAGSGKGGVASQERIRCRP